MRTMGSCDPERQQCLHLAFLPRTLLFPSDFLSLRFLEVHKKMPSMDIGHKQIFSQRQYFNVVNLSKLKPLVAVF